MSPSFPGLFPAGLDSPVQSIYVLRYQGQVKLPIQHTPSGVCKRILPRKKKRKKKNQLPQASK